MKGLLCPTCNHVYFTETHLCFDGKGWRVVTLEDEAITRAAVLATMRNLLRRGLIEGTDEGDNVVVTAITPAGRLILAAYLDA